MKTQELKNDFEKALSKLKDILNKENIEEEILRDATVQRFEFTFELSWKYLKSKLSDVGIFINSPRETIKESFKNDFIKNGEAWLKMLEDRNYLSHIYDEGVSKAVYPKIKDHVKLFEEII